MQLGLNTNHLTMTQRSFDAGTLDKMIRHGFLIGVMALAALSGGCATGGLTQASGPSEWGCLAGTPTAVVAEHYLGIGFENKSTGATISAGSDAKCAADAAPAEAAVPAPVKKKWHPKVKAPVPAASTEPAKG